jgi:hypothetical protein
MLKLSFAALGLVLSAGFASAQPTAQYEITITNITPGQSFTPQLVATHTGEFILFKLGEPASEALEMLAEGGDTGPLTESMSAAATDVQTIPGLVSPVLEPSMLGKRDHCFIETLVFALPPTVLALFLVYRLFPLRPVYGAALVCLAAGMMPALYMQIACMYAPVHILQMHIFPGLLVMVAGTLGMRLVVWLR